MRSDVFDLISSTLLALTGVILWVIWQEIKGLRKSRHKYGNILTWLLNVVEKHTGEQYREVD